MNDTHPPERAVCPVAQPGIPAPTRGRWWGLLVGVGGLVLVVAAGVVRWKSTGKRVDRTAYAVLLVGWALVAQFLLKPLIPSSVVAAVLLGGITAGILAAAVVGSRRTRGHDR